MKSIILRPAFLIGLAVRLALIAFIVPKAPQDWYVPFMDVTSSHLSLDPWTTFINAGGSSRAFPYGYVMWFAFLPFTWVGQWLHLPLHWSYGATLLIADICAMRLLSSLFDIRPKPLIWLYWLSPVTLFAAYVLGLNDIVPVALLCTALLALRRNRPLVAGLICGMAVSAKLSMLLTVPIIGIYLFRNKALRKQLAPFVTGLGAILVITGVPFLLSHDAIYMLVRNPEMAKTSEFRLGIGSGRDIYLLPMAYVLMLYLCWRIRRISFDLLHVFLGIAFFLVLLLTPAAPGWFVWVMPLLVYYQVTTGRVSIVLVSCFSAAYIATTLLSMHWPSIAAQPVFPEAQHLLAAMFDAQAINLLNTVLIAFGIILVVRIWREAVHYNDYFRLSRKAVVIGIAGDSGAGKDTLVDSIAGLFGQHSVVRVSGDDYHHWDRHKPMWQVMTHLNPRANDLERFAGDVMALADGRPVHARHYDHASGKLSKPQLVKSNDFIVASGLHALYQPLLRTYYDLSIYLDIDENLRRYFKVRRDVHKRHHELDAVLASIEKRSEDAELFVKPQLAHADLVFSLQPIHPRIIANPADDRLLRFKLGVRSRYGLREHSLERTLVGICGLHVDTMLVGDESVIEMTIEGETSAEDVAMAARHLIPHADVLLDNPPHWEAGITGLMQLIVLSHLTQALMKRLS